MSQLFWTRRLAFVLVLIASQDAVGADAPGASPDRYLVDFPPTQQFCPPVETYFDDASQALQKVGSRTIRHQLNGGYGLPVVDIAGGQHLLHLGSDVAWYQVGAPVYAIADGVVRISQGAIDLSQIAKKKSAETTSSDTSKKSPVVSGDDLMQGDLPLPDSDAPSSNATKTSPGKPSAAKQPPALGWGNIIVIEHHLPDDTYVTSIYGHLGNRRLVNKGDTVRAGQVIGFIGKAGVENGGFKPHLHFGLRDGRMFEPGCKLLTMFINGRPTAMTLVGFTDTEAAVKIDEFVPTPLRLQYGGQEINITQHDEKCFIPLSALNYMQRPDFAIVGYGLSTKGWRDPTEFLLQSLDKFPRAAFEDIPSQKRAVADKRR